MFVNLTEPAKPDYVPLCNDPYLYFARKLDAVENLMITAVNQ